jgi:CPA1 family monovalent cation:H+ antiporter
MDALGFASIVILIVFLARFAVCLGLNRFEAWQARRNKREPRASFKQAILASWCGMRGLVTLATAYALPSDFPERDTVVLTAFAVVLATLVVQGLTLTPLIKWLQLDRRKAGASELASVRNQILLAGLSRLEGLDYPQVELLRSTFLLEQQALTDPSRAAMLAKYRKLALKAISGQREMLEQLRTSYELNVDEYNLLLEEIDWRELSVLPEDARRIEEI